MRYRLAVAINLVAACAGNHRATGCFIYRRSFSWARLAAGLIDYSIAGRIHPTLPEAENAFGSFAAASSDWRFGDADSMSARDIDDPIPDAG